jgi:hypothetical protein
VQVLDELGISDPLLDIARNLEKWPWKTITL